MELISVVSVGMVVVFIVIHDIMTGEEFRRTRQMIKDLERKIDGLNK